MRGPLLQRSALMSMQGMSQQCSCHSHAAFYSLVLTAASPACSKVQTVKASDSPPQVLEQLQKARVSQLPVVDADGNLVTTCHICAPTNTDQCT